jgi:hypothetical protein
MSRPRWSCPAGPPFLQNHVHEEWPGFVVRPCQGRPCRPRSTAHVTPWARDSERTIRCRWRQSKNFLVRVLNLIDLLGQRATLLGKSASRPFAWSHEALIPRVAYNLAWSTLTHTLTRVREEGTEVDAQLAAFLFLFPFILKQNAMEIVMPPNRSCHPMTWNTAMAILLYRISYSIGSDRAGTTLSKLKNRNWKIGTEKKV